MRLRTARSHIIGRHEEKLAGQKLIAYFYNESASGVKITRPTLLNEIVNSTMRSVDFVVGGVVNPVIMVFFVDGWLWRQLKISDRKDPAKQIPEAGV